MNKVTKTLQFKTPLTHMLSMVHLFILLSWSTMNLTYHNNFGQCKFSRTMSFFSLQYHMIKTRIMKTIIFA